jgi:hypothetical protein
VAGKLLKGAYGSLVLYLLDVTTPGGRKQVVHEPANGDGYVLQDRGLVHERVQCELVFCQMVDEREDHFTRYKRLLALIKSGTPQIFTHPLHGSYLARIGETSLSTPPDGEDFSLTVEFLQETPVVAVRSIGGIYLGPLSGLIGPDAVDAHVEDMRLLVEEFPDVQTSAPAAAAATVSGWTSSGAAANARQVDVELGSTIQDIDAEIEDLDLAEMLDRWPLYKAMIMLRALVVDAAAAASANNGQSYDLELKVPTPVRALLARVYGAAAAEQRIDEFRQLNPGLRSPLIPPGRYRLPAPGTR